MTNKIETGGPAFPSEHSSNSPAPNGMSLRDYFAAKAMQGFAADSECTWKDRVKGMASSAYELADAMLEARK